MRGRHEPKAFKIWDEVLPRSLARVIGNPAGAGAAVKDERSEPQQRARSLTADLAEAIPIHAGDAVGKNRRRQ